MKIELGLIPSELTEQAKKGEIPQYFVCKVEVYRSISCAKRDNIKPDLSRHLEIRDPKDPKKIIERNRDHYFTSRFYRVIDLTNPDEYIPCSDLPELRQELKQRSAKGINYLKEKTEILEREEIDASYVLTSLMDTELSDLLAK